MTCKIIRSVISRGHVFTRCAFEDCTAHEWLITAGLNGRLIPCCVVHATSGARDMTEDDIQALSVQDVMES